jgi:hypothetical protein
MLSGETFLPDNQLAPFAILRATPGREKFSNRNPLLDAPTNARLGNRVLASAALDVDQGPSETRNCNLGRRTLAQGSYDDRVRHFDRDGDLHPRVCVVVVHRAKEKAEEKRSASAKGDRAIARKPNANGVVRPANDCLAEPEAVSLWREPMGNLIDGETS